MIYDNNQNTIDTFSGDTFEMRDELTNFAIGFSTLNKSETGQSTPPHVAKLKGIFICNKKVQKKLQHTNVLILILHSKNYGIF